MPRRPRLAPLGLIACCALALFAGAAPAGASASAGAHKAIIGGVDANLAADWPFIADIRVAGEQHCGGSVLTPTKVLTAAHCVVDTDPASMVVIQRINLGLYAIFGEMRATANWRRLAEELWPFVDAPPSTPMGEAIESWRLQRAGQAIA